MRAPRGRGFVWFQFNNYFTHRDRVVDLQLEGLLLQVFERELHGEPVNSDNSVKNAG